MTGFRLMAPVDWKGRIVTGFRLMAPVDWNDDSCPEAERAIDRARAPKKLRLVRREID